MALETRDLVSSAENCPRGAGMDVFVLHNRASFRSIIVINNLNSSLVSSLIIIIIAII